MIYLDNHATTPCDPRVAQQMMPWLVEHFGNPHSTSHEMGREAKSAMDAALAMIASHLGVTADSVSSLEEIDFDLPSVDQCSQFTGVDHQRGDREQ